MKKRPSPLSSASKGDRGGESADKPLDRFNQLTKSLLTVSNRTVKDLETKERLRNRRKKEAREKRD